MKILRFIMGNIEEIISGALFVAMTLMTFVNVISRYIFNVTFAWPEELSRYCFMWITFIGAALCTKNDRHIVIDFLVLKTSGRTRTIFKVAGHIAIIALMLILLYYGWKLAVFTKIETSTLNISKSYILYVVPFSALLILFRVLGKIIRDIKNLNN
jgi:TRAP-type C4-dicarboxylate transport system permease small subunit